ncbi:MAG: hypothetical protein QHJ34_05165 [bacterium]|jgi:hypothetical protein|nr:hypothetical protein [candidate division KSB1 bacterium]MDH7559608.1 hypothetical protein [bacterium]
MLFFRLLLIALLIYLAVKVWRSLSALFGSDRMEVRGAQRRGKPPLDLEGKDVEDAKYREIPPAEDEQSKRSS